MEIRIEPHPAREIVHGEPVQIIFDQQQVMVDGVRVAWCGDKPGKPLSFIRHYPEAFIQQIKAFVEKALEGKVSHVGRQVSPADIEALEYAGDDADESEGDA